MRAVMVPSHTLGPLDPINKLRPCHVLIQLLFILLFRYPAVLAYKGLHQHDFIHIVLAPSVDFFQIIAKRHFMLIMFCYKHFMQLQVLLFPNICHIELNFQALDPLVWSHFFFFGSAISFYIFYRKRSTSYYTCNSITRLKRSTSTAYSSRFSS